MRKPQNKSSRELGYYGPDLRFGTVVVIISMLMLLCAITAAIIEIIIYVLGL